MLLCYSQFFGTVHCLYQHIPTTDHTRIVSFSDVFSGYDLYKPSLTLCSLLQIQPAHNLLVYVFFPMHGFPF